MFAGGRNYRRLEVAKDGPHAGDGHPALALVEPKQLLDSIVFQRASSPRNRGSLMLCTQCGRESDGFKPFCQFCGTKLIRPRVDSTSDPAPRPLVPSLRGHDAHDSVGSVPSERGSLRRWAHPIFSGRAIRVRDILLGLAGVVVVLLTYVALGPFIAIHEIKAGIESQDSEKLGEYVDFPALRENLKQQFDAYLIQSNAPDQSNPFGALAAVIGQEVVGHMIDSAVTPAGLATISTGGKAQPSGGPRLEPFYNAHYRYESTSRFSALIRDDTGGETRFVFRRYWISWKLSNVIIPRNVISPEGAPSAATQSGPQLLSPDASMPTQSPVKVESIDSRITETNDVWARYAWKLAVSNSGDNTISFGVHIEWQDADGFVIDDDNESGLAVQAHGTETFTGYELIRYPGAFRVSKIEAKLTKW